MDVASLTVGGVVGVVLTKLYDLLKPELQASIKAYWHERRQQRLHRLTPTYGSTGDLWQREGTSAGDAVAGPNGEDMVWVPAGDFHMGNDNSSREEGPRHLVRISRGFWIGRNLVTNAQYAAFLNEFFRRDASLAKKDSGVTCERSQIRFEQQAARFLPHDGCEDLPAQGVTWFDASRYAAFFEMRLPTEAQWEYAARGTDARTYPWGDNWVAGYCCSSENPGPPWDWQRKQPVEPQERPDTFRVTRTYPVGSFPPGASWCGAYDMVGNLMEWCTDWHGPYAATHPNEPQVDPRGPARGTIRVVRGGNWFYGRTVCTTTCRRHSTRPEYSSDSIGFRCVYTPLQ